MKNIRRAFELLMLEQLVHKLVSRIFDFFLLRVRLRGRSICVFYVNQGGCHHQELACDADVQLLHRAQVFEVLLGDPRDGNVIYRDFFFANEIEQQVERPSNIESLTLYWSVLSANSV